MADSAEKNQVDAQLDAATVGFKYIFNDDIPNATKTFQAGDSPFHQLGLGVTHFLQAALGMEDDRMALATTYLQQAEQGASQQAKLARAGRSRFIEPEAGQFPAGTEWDILLADATVLLGLTYVLQESYTGLVKCFWHLNNAHSMFNKTFYAVYPNGLDGYSTPTMSRSPSELDLPRSATTSSASSSLSSTASSIVSTASTSKAASLSPTYPVASRKPPSTGMLSSWFGTSARTTPSSPISTGPVVPRTTVDGLVLSGAAFGFGLFNLILSLLPPKVRNVVSFLGFKSQRPLGLRALGVAANGDDVHSEFAALALMTYNGFVLLMTGFQADEALYLKQYDAYLTRVESKYPYGSLWSLNRAKLERYKGNNEKAIELLKHGLDPAREIHFQQADAMLVFELAWLLLAERRYEESATTFLRMQELNQWSSTTYSWLAAGCYISVGTPEAREKARVQINRLPKLLEQKKIGGKDLPTETFIRNRIALFKRKAVSRGIAEEDFMDVISLSPAEELGLIWNNHTRLTKQIAEAHIHHFLKLRPAPKISTPYLNLQSEKDGSVTPISPISPTSLSPHASSSIPLTLPDEFVARDLLLGVLHRETGHYTEARAFLRSATQIAGVEAEWITKNAWIELAVLELKVVSVELGKEGVSDVVGDSKQWKKALSDALAHLDVAGKSARGIDLGSRIETRVALLRDEIEMKKQTLGIV